MNFQFRFDLRVKPSKKGTVTFVVYVFVSGTKNKSEE